MWPRVMRRARRRRRAAGRLGQAMNLRGHESTTFSHGPASIACAAWRSCVPGPRPTPTVARSCRKSRWSSSPSSAVQATCRFRGSSVESRGPSASAAAGAPPACPASPPARAGRSRAAARGQPDRAGGRPAGIPGSVSCSQRSCGITQPGTVRVARHQVQAPGTVRGGRPGARAEHPQRGTGRGTGQVGRVVGGPDGPGPGPDRPVEHGREQALAQPAVKARPPAAQRGGRRRPRRGR